ncbi:MAG: O-antigen ligase family protein [Endomicrobiia bacterium]
MLLDIISFLTGLILFLSPLLEASWDVWSKTIIHLLTIFTVLVYIIFSKNKLKLSLPSKFHLFVLFLFIIWLFINLLYSKIKLHTEFELHNFINYFLILYILNNIELQNVQKILKYIIPCLFLIILVSFYQFLIRHHQPQGTMVNPNILAGYLIMCIPILVYFIEVNSQLKYILYPLIVLTSICLVLSMSFGAIFSLITAFLIIRFRWKIGILFSIVLFLLLISFGIINENSISDRTFWWYSTYNIIKENPVTGTGLGTFEYVYPKYRISKLGSMFAHSSFLQFTSETGIIGCLLLVTIIILFTKRVSNKYFKLSLLSVIFQNIIDYNLYILSNGILFCFILDIGNKLANHNENSKYLIYYFGKFAKIPLIILLILYSVSVLKLYFSTVNYNIGKNLITSGSFNSAEGYLTKSIKIKPNSWFVYGRLSDIYQKKYEQNPEKNILYKSIEILEKGINFNPYCSQYYYKLSQIYSIIGEKNKSVFYLKKFYEYGGESRKYLDY